MDRSIFSRLRSYLPHLLSLAAIGVFVGYLVRNVERYKTLLDFSPVMLLFLVVLVLAMMVGNGLVNYFLYRRLGAELLLDEAIELAAVNTLANQLPFAGGIIAKAGYLKKRYRLPLLRFFSATLALYVLLITVGGLIGITTLLYLSLAHNRLPSFLLLVAFTGMASVVLVFWLPVDRISLTESWEKRLQQVLDGWQLLRKDRTVLGKLILIHLFMTLLFAGRFWLTFQALSQDITLIECILFSAARTLAQLVIITPGALGVREGIVAAVASLNGFAPDISIVAVGLDRLVETTVVIGVGAFSSYILSRKAVMPEPVEQLGEGLHGTYLAESDSSPDSICDGQRQSTRHPLEKS